MFLLDQWLIGKRTASENKLDSWYFDQNSKTSTNTKIKCAQNIKHIPRLS